MISVIQFAILITLLATLTNTIFLSAIVSIGYSLGAKVQSALSPQSVQSSIGSVLSSSQMNQAIASALSSPEVSAALQNAIISSMMFAPEGNGKRSIPNENENDDYAQQISQLIIAHPSVLDAIRNSMIISTLSVMDSQNDALDTMKRGVTSLSCNGINSEPLCNKTMTMCNQLRTCYSTQTAADCRNVGTYATAVCNIAQRR
jgi:hypothetical protein